MRQNGRNFRRQLGEWKAVVLINRSLCDFIVVKVPLSALAYIGKAEMDGCSGVAMIAAAETVCPK